MGAKMLRVKLKTVQEKDRFVAGLTATGIAAIPLR
jgi:hypothetical protein